MLIPEWQINKFNTKLELMVWWQAGPVGAAQRVALPSHRPQQAAPGWLDNQWLPSSSCSCPETSAGWVWAESLPGEEHKEKTALPLASFEMFSWVGNRWSTASGEVLLSRQRGVTPGLSQARVKVVGMKPWEEKPGYTGRSKSMIAVSQSQRQTSRS